MEYKASDYEFPEAYVEGVESDVYLEPNPDKGVYRKCRAAECEGRVRLGMTVYEEAGRLFLDIVSGEIVRKTAIVIPRLGRKALYVEPGTPAMIYEAGGLQTVFNLYEGARVDPGDKIAYILTSKGETRSLRSEDKGIILYIAWDRESFPPKYWVVVVPEERVYILDPEVEGTG